MSAEPLAWLMVGRTGHRLVFDASQVSPDIGARYAASGWEVTPLVAAPPPIGEAGELVSRLDDAWASHGEYADDDVEILRALCGEAMVAVRHLASVAVPPEDGRPTYAELASWIAEHGEHDTKCFQRSRGNRCVCGLESLLSRIPREEPHEER